jgi:hypothetical protein
VRRDRARRRQASRRTQIFGLWVLSAALAAGAAGFSASSSLAERAPSRSEAHELRTFAVAWCHQNTNPVGGPCVYGADNRLAAYRTRVSTVDPRFAWADITADGLSGLLVKRPHRTGGHWKVIAAGGGGVSNCSDWYKVVSHRVSADLGLVGLIRGVYGGGVCR